MATKPKGAKAGDRQTRALETIAANLGHITKAVESLIPEKLERRQLSQSELRRYVEQIRAAASTDAALKGLAVRDDFGEKGPGRD